MLFCSVRYSQQLYIDVKLSLKMSVNLKIFGVLKIFLYNGRPVNLNMVVFHKLCRVALYTGAHKTECHTWFMAVSSTASDHEQQNFIVYVAICYRMEMTKIDTSVHVSAMYSR